MFSVISPLHPPRGDLQSPLGRPRGQPSHLSLERLRPRQPATPDDPGGRGVLAPLPAPRASPQLRSHPPLRLSGPPTALRSLPLCFQFLGRPTDLPAAPEPQPGEEEGCSTRQPSTPTWSCPQCGGPMIILGATDGGGDVLTFSTPLLREVLMKYRSLTRKRPRVPTTHTPWCAWRLPTTPPSSAQQRTPHPIHPRFTLHPCFLALTNSSRWLTQLTYDHSYAIQSP